MAHGVALLASTLEGSTLSLPRLSLPLSLSPSLYTLCSPLSSSCCFRIPIRKRNSFVACGFIATQVFPYWELAPLGKYKNTHIQTTTVHGKGDGPHFRPGTYNPCTYKELIS